jgi:IS5 family transposase
MLIIKGSTIFVDARYSVNLAKTLAFMINYTPQSQLSLELFKHPFDQELDRNNRWVKMATVIPWDDLATVYSKKLDSGAGRHSVDIRTVIAALIIKHKLGLDDRGTVQMIQENIYLQYFCGLKSFTTKPVFDPSLFVDIRKRLGGKEFDAFNRQIIEKSEKIVPRKSKIKREHTEKSDEPGCRDKHDNNNRGTLKVDATVADQEVRYPTDINLLSKGREKLERIIDVLYIAGSDGVKPRTYRRVARKCYLNIAKKKRKSGKEIRHGLKVQLQYVRRDIKLIDQLLSKPGRGHILIKRDRELLATIRAVYQQQKWMYDNKKHSCPNRIISLFQPHVRPIVRGKDNENTEFGSKINVSEVNGFCRIDRLNWDAYNESTDVKMQVERFRSLYGCYPKVFLGDSIYLTRENRKYLKDNGIEIYGKPLGRPVKHENQSAQEKYRKRKKAAERNHIEGKFGQAKRGYGMNNIKARLMETSESWINSIIFVMNLTKLIEIAEKYSGIFICFFEKLKLSFSRHTSWLFFSTNTSSRVRFV